MPGHASSPPEGRGSARDGVTQVTRRRFIQYGAGTTAGLLLYGYRSTTAVAQLPGGTLDPTTIPKYRSALVIPPAMPRTPKNRLPRGLPKNVDYYEIAVRQFRQQVLPPGLPR